MSKLIEMYLDRVMAVAELSGERATQVRDELSDHLQSDYERLRQSGRSEEDSAWEAIRRMGHPNTVGRRIVRPFAWLDIRTNGTARGFVAIGPRAVGVFAFGGMACGVFAFGGLALGVFTFGGLGLGCLAFGGLALGLIACGGLAVGGVAGAGGGTAVGFVAWAQDPHGLTTLSRKGALLTQGPDWVRPLEPFVIVPQALVAHMGWVMAIYFLVLTVIMCTQWMHAVRLRRQDTKNWLFD